MSLTPRNLYDLGNLRLEDKILRSHLKAYPLAPRPIINRWYPIYHTQYAVMGVFLLFLFIFGAYIIMQLVEFTINAYVTRDNIVAMISIPTVTIVMLLSYCCLPVGFYRIWIKTVYLWWKGQSVGRPATAVLQSITRRATPKAFDGVWLVQLNAQETEVTFGVNAARDDHKTWVTTIQPGDRIGVLLHPQRCEILLAYGPLDPRSELENELTNNKGVLRRYKGKETKHTYGKTKTNVYVYTSACDKHH